MFRKKIREVSANEDEENSYYTGILKKIKDGSLYQRELSLSYPVVPGIGQTSSRVRIYYDMLDRDQGDYDISILRIENYYQHAGMVLYEELVYDSRGGLIFYYGCRGSGDINRPAEITWIDDERFYFQAGRPVRVMYGQETHDSPTAADLKKAASRLHHGQRLRSGGCDLRFPAPLKFNDSINP